MKFEYFDLVTGTSEMVDFEPPQSSMVNMHTSLFALFLISEGREFDIAIKKLDDLGAKKVAELIGDKWPPESYTADVIKEYANILISA